MIKKERVVTVEGSEKWQGQCEQTITFWKARI